jgi:hypothetical protein
MKNDIESVKKAFETWRKSKNSTRGRIPKELWEKAFKLSKTYGYNRTAKELGLNPSTLRNKNSTSNTSLAHDVKFVKVAPLKFLDNEPAVNTSFNPRNTMIAEIVSPSGIAVRLFSGIDSSCTEVLTRFFKES